MTLIDILLRELPKRDGWPGAIPVLVQNSSGYVYQAGCGEYIYRLKLADDWMDAEVTCEKYFDALRALKPVWDGNGLPPVGVECEMSYSDDEWYRCVIIAKGEEQIIYKREGCEEFSGHRNNYRFRTVRSEVDKKRDAAISAIDAACLLVRDASKTAAAIYDAIAAGDIPGVKIE